MSIGYACINVGSEKTRLSTIRLNNATKEKLHLVIAKNLAALEAIIDYNIKNKIKLFRISSDIIPLGSHPVNTTKWWLVFEEQLNLIGAKIAKSRMRVSMHPGQYTVLNSLNSDVVRRAFSDLEYHCRFLDSLGCDSSCKIILHIGGVYSDKQTSQKRFISNYQKLSNSIKKRIVIENDDKSYNIQDVLGISQKTGIPVVFDNLHHQLNSPDNRLNQYEYIDICSNTWASKDGKQKIHYSQSKKDGIRGSHSKHINSYEFINFYNKLSSKSIDIMLEVKDKNLSAVKCNILVDDNLKIQSLEKEWACYKYFVLSRSSSIYNYIRELLKDKDNPNALLFYKNIDKAFTLGVNVGAEINSAQHVWGYVSKKACEKDRKKFDSLIYRYKNSEVSDRTIKRFLFRLAREQEVNYLLESLYFYI